MSSLGAHRWPRHKRTDSSVIQTPPALYLYHLRPHIGKGGCQIGTGEEHAQVQDSHILQGKPLHVLNNPSFSKLYHLYGSQTD